MEWNKEQSVNYWDGYYETHACPDEPSLFAKFCLTKVDKPCRLLDLGCGNGRDSKFFASCGFEVIACDQSRVALEELDGINHITTLNSDFESLAQNFTDKVDVVYSRFSLHAVDEATARDTLRWANEHLSDDGKLYLEMRSVEDSFYGEGVEVESNAFVTDHYRRFETLDRVAEELKNIGFNIDFAACERGFAPFKDEDPKVIRIIASNYT